jgi:hypothetical protein
MGTIMEPVPVTGLAANFSPIPRIAPPPLGSDIEGREVEALPVVALVSLSKLGVCVRIGDGVSLGSIDTSLNSTTI